MYALIDCNSFYVSCEEVFQPKLKGKPVAVLSSNDGCIISRSKAAKNLGIKIGDPGFFYKDRKDIFLISCNLPLYADMSARVMDTLKTVSSQVEVYSIDEAFIKLEIDPKLIIEKIQKWMGIPTSIGIGMTKTQAKLAAEFAKESPDGICDFRDLKLQTIPVQDIWGIGKKNMQKLQKLSIFTVDEFLNAPDTILQKHLSVLAVRLQIELKSIQAIDLLEQNQPKKSITYSRSFGKTISEKQELLQAISYFTANVCQTLREQNSVTGFLTVFAYTKESESFYRHITINTPTAVTSDLISSAKKCIEDIWNSTTGPMEYKKAGIMLSEISPQSNHALDFLDKKPCVKKESLMKVIDTINRKFEKQSIQFAAEGMSKPWKSKQTKLSPKYTTSWDDLIKVF